MSATVDHERFEQLVADAVDGIPEPFASHLENIDIVVEDEPGRDELSHLGIGPSGTLFGLYQGVPLTQRGPSYSWVLPDKITIFRGPILRACRDDAEVVAQVTKTVVHEIAHHFGISDERLRELGW